MNTEEQHVSGEIETKESVGEANIDETELVVGLFALNLDEITLVSLKQMRYVLPREDYRRLKDRISARMIRRKRARKTNRLLCENSLLKNENQRLRQLVTQRLQAMQGSNYLEPVLHTGAEIWREMPQPLSVRYIEPVVSMPDSFSFYEQESNAQYVQLQQPALHLFSKVDEEQN